MKIRVAAIACALMAIAPWGPTGCVFHSRRPLSRTPGLQGPLQLDSPREHRVPNDIPPAQEMAPVGPRH